MKKEEKHLKKKKNKIIKILVIMICVAAMIFSGYKIFTWWQENKKSEEILNDISGKVILQDIEDEDRNSIKKYVIDFEGLKEKNIDTVAWIKVENTNIEYPVVKANDNNYYLTKSFDKSYNSAGWVFMDYRNKTDGTDKNTVIYGHNRKDKSMFGTLKNVFTEGWYNNEQNKFITYITENEYSIYEIFSAYRIEEEDYYITTDFKNDEEYEQFLKKIKSRSFKNFNVDVTNDDQILTLSTCSNANYRAAVHAKKIQ